MQHTGGQGESGAVGTPKKPGTIEQKLSSTPPATAMAWGLAQEKSERVP